MCVNRVSVYNRYIRRSFMVDCGKCPACLQKKATLITSRIKNNLSSDMIVLFVTLTYDNHYIPYILVEDVYDEVANIPIYRDYNISRRRYRDDNNVYAFAPFTYRCGEIDRLYVGEYPPDLCTSHFLPIRKKADNQISIIYYPDLQNFYKRLRINLKRHYNYDEPFTFFACAEYGPTTFRAHFHTLLFIPQSYEQMFRNAIVESWPYANSERTRKYIELARNAASYVASYVNCSSSVPSLFKNRVFRQKHSYSKNFGLASSDFGLLEILKKADNRDMSYRKLLNREGIPSVVNVPIPKYVINRYFPEFKGLSRLSPDSLRVVLQYPERLRDFKLELDYSDLDLHAISVRLSHALNHYRLLTGKQSSYDYAIDYLRVWNARKNYVLSHQYDDVLTMSDYGYFYDNLNEWFFGVVHSDSLDSLNLHRLELNPNALPRNVSETSYYSSLFHKKIKQRKVTNSAMSQIGHNV